MKFPCTNSSLTKEEIEFAFDLGVDDDNEARVVKWVENQIVLVAKLRTPFQIQIVLVAKLRSNFQNQIAIAKNCEIAIAKSCEKLRFSHFGLENHSET